jgi:rhodanese-related sulfurtransferase
MSKSRHVLAAGVAALALGAPLAACGGDDDAAPVLAAEQPAAETPAASAEAPAYGLVTPQQAAELATKDGITVIDVRTQEEYDEGHIDGATVIDFYAPDFADQVAQLDPEGEYLVYCRSGNRSGQAVAIMQQAGIDNIYDMDGGIVAYSAAGLPLV